MTDDASFDSGWNPSNGTDVVGELTRWLAEARVDAAATARARERWLRQQLDEEATVAGILLDLAERGSTVVLRGRSGRSHRGLVRAVSDDFCALRSGDGIDVLLTYDGIVSIEPHRDATVLSGSRPAALDTTLREALTFLAGERRRVLTITGDDIRIAGELRSVGRDVLVLRPDGDARAVYLPLTSITEVLLTD